ncbi:DUF1684 domain-containing protein [Mucilaginibacter roseus]|uniref:DUF1684 domain-containing protein n=1 Tax=Mucilaginibacter roseus TaxID=1528868 RepID=A0ABS8U4Y4_9SPHI|nr:DUF1684 domain-containing protein [Mucilaginibacter roseus]MCD8741108.1 DUF1684 domain-containing protein [Mucilaginibacter roseus]
MMKKLLLSIGLLTAITTANAQSFKEQIAAHRQKYKDDFLAEQRSPLKAEDLPNLRFFDADSTYSIVAKVELLQDQPVIKLTTFNGSSQEYVRFAKLTFTLKGKQLHLTLFKSLSLTAIPQYKDYLFLPFTDQTNAAESYPGGRYIDINATDIKNGALAIDFNKAYNPYCAYSDGYRCPVPPMENKLGIRVEAGEKAFAGEKKH